MGAEEKEIGRFVFGVKTFQDSEGKIEVEVKSANEGIPDEIIIMNMKGFLERVEKNFYERFKN